MFVTFSGYLLGGILILSLIILLNLRFIFHKHATIDSVVLASPIAFVFTIFYILAFNLNAFSLSILILTIIVLITNYRALQRFFAGLYVDYYRTAFRIASFLEAFIAGLLIILLFIFCPVQNTLAKTADSTKTILTGTSTYGLSKKDQVFSPTSAVIQQFSPKEPKYPKSEVILCVPDLLCDTKDYFPIVQQLIDEGFTVFLADVFLPDVQYFNSFFDSSILKSFIMRTIYAYNNQYFNENLSQYIDSKSKEILAAKNFLQKEFPNIKIKLLTDTYTTLSVKNLISEENMIKYNNGGFGMLSKTLPFEYSFANKSVLSNILKK